MVVLKYTESVSKEIWRHRVMIKPVHKDGSKYEIENYRTISLLSVFSQIFETLMYERINGFLN